MIDDEQSTEWDEDPPDFDDEPPLQYTLANECLDGRISLKAMAESLGMDLAT